MCTKEVTAFSAHSLLSLELKLNYLQLKNRRLSLRCGMGSQELTRKLKSLFIHFQGIALFHFVRWVTASSVVSAICLQNHSSKCRFSKHSSKGALLHPSQLEFSAPPVTGSTD